MSRQIRKKIDTKTLKNQESRETAQLDWKESIKEQLKTVIFGENDYNDLEGKGEIGKLIDFIEEKCAGPGVVCQQMEAMSSIIGDGMYQARRIYPGGNTTYGRIKILVFKNDDGTKNWLI